MAAKPQESGERFVSWPEQFLGPIFVPGRQCSSIVHGQFPIWAIEYSAAAAAVSDSVVNIGTVVHLQQSTTVMFL